MDLVKQIGRMNHQVVNCKTVGIIIEEQAEFTKRLQFFVTQIDCFGILARHLVKIVAKGADYRPWPEFSSQQPINDEGGAKEGRGIYVGFQEIGGGNVATVVMVRVKKKIPVRQQFFKLGPVSIKRDIQDGDAAGDCAREACKECYVAFDTGDESSLRLRLVQAELVQSAKAIRITIEDIDTVHERVKAAKGADSSFLKTGNINTESIADIGKTKSDHEGLISGR